MISLARMLHRTRRRTLGCIVLIGFGATTTFALEPRLVLVSGQATMIIRMELSGGEFILRQSTYSDSKSSKLEDAMLAKLDRDRDEVLSAGELAAAESLLDRYDYDEDECLAPLELASDLLTSHRSTPPSQNVVALLIRSKDDSESIATLRQELARRGQPDVDAFQRSDATIRFDGDDDQKRVVVQMDGDFKARMKPFIESGKLHSSGATSFLLVKRDLTVDWFTELNDVALNSGAVNIDLRPGRSGLFEWLDADGNSKLSRTELRSAADLGSHCDVLNRDRSFDNSVAVRIGDSKRRHASVSLLPNAAEKPHGAHDASDWFLATDQNRDGVLSINEFLAGDRRFESLDSNHDGLLTRVEAEAK